MRKIIFQVSRATDFFFDLRKMSQKDSMRLIRDQITILIENNQRSIAKDIDIDYLIFEFGFLIESNIIYKLLRLEKFKQRSR